jgi:hypothetical protein
MSAKTLPVPVNAAAFMLTPDEVADLCTFAYGASCDPPPDCGTLAIGWLDTGEQKGWHVWDAEQPQDGAVPLHRYINGNHVTNDCTH